LLKENEAMLGKKKNNNNNKKKKSGEDWRTGG